jgi:rubrerythrin
MEPITTREKLIENLKNVLSVEIIARDSYDKDVHIFKDKRLKTVIEKIKNDEIRHIKMLNELIEMLESY